MSSPQGPYSDDRGTYFLVLGWTLTSLAVTAIVLRLYTRLVLTRSAGSDDLAISFSFGLTIAGEIGDSIAVAHGLGRHQQYLTVADIASIVKWEFIDLINVFISLFFLRCSVMLFTLRLLPATKIWPQRIILVTFFLNFAITMIVVVTYGVKCVPFPAIYRSYPDARCIPENTVVITQQLNGVLACVIDITTALIPAFLLWRIRIKRSTKVVLDILFLMGLITAGLSIGRAATTNTGIWEKDTTWRIQVPNTFSMVEEKLGLVFACGPAMRQLIVHTMRNKTILPRRRPPGSGEDFIKFRKKVKLRDIFWFRKAHASQLATFIGSPIYPPEAYIDSSTHHQAEQDAKRSPLDIWKTSLGAVFGRSKDVRRLSSNANATAPARVENEERLESPHLTTDPASFDMRSWPGSKTDSEKGRIAGRYRERHISPRAASQWAEGRNDSERLTSASFFREDSNETFADEPMSSQSASSEVSETKDSSYGGQGSSTSSSNSRSQILQSTTPRVRSHANFSRPHVNTSPKVDLGVREKQALDKFTDHG